MADCVGVGDGARPPWQISQAAVRGQTTCPMHRFARWMMWMRIPPSTISQISSRNSGDSFDSRLHCDWDAGAACATPVP